MGPDSPFCSLHTGSPDYRSHILFLYLQSSFNINLRSRHVSHSDRIHKQLFTSNETVNGK